MPNTSAGFHANDWPHPSCLNIASENFTVTAFQLPSVGSMTGSPHSSPHLSTPSTASSHVPWSWTCVDARMTTFARRVASLPGDAIAQNATPANPVRSYGIRCGDTPPSPPGPLKSAPTPAPHVEHAFQLACSACPRLTPGGGTADVLA